MIFHANGERVAFLSDITGNFQVWSAPIAGGGWPQQLSFFDDKVWELYGTDAASHTIAVGDVGGNERHADEGHKISKLVNRVDGFTRMAAFLDRVL